MFLILSSSWNSTTENKIFSIDTKRYFRNSFHKIKNFLTRYTANFAKDRVTIITNDQKQSSSIQQHNNSSFIKRLTRLTTGNRHVYKTEGINSLLAKTRQETTTIIAQAYHRSLRSCPSVEGMRLSCPLGNANYRLVSPASNTLLNFKLMPHPSQRFS